MPRARRRPVDVPGVLSSILRGSVLTRSGCALHSCCLNTVQLGVVAEVSDSWRGRAPRVPNLLCDVKRALTTGFVAAIAALPTPL